MAMVHGEIGFGGTSLQIGGGLEIVSGDLVFLRKRFERSAGICRRSIRYINVLI